MYNVWRMNASDRTSSSRSSCCCLAQQGNNSRAKEMERKRERDNNRPINRTNNKLLRFFVCLIITKSFCSAWFSQHISFMYFRESKYCTYKPSERTTHQTPNRHMLYMRQYREKSFVISLTLWAESIAYKHTYVWKSHLQIKIATISVWMAKLSNSRLQWFI